MCSLAKYSEANFWTFCGCASNSSLSLLPPNIDSCRPKMSDDLVLSEKLLVEVAETARPDGLSVITKHLSARTQLKCHCRPCQQTGKRPSRCVCVRARVTFSTSRRCVLSYLGASQESCCRADAEAPRSSANSLLMHHLCPSAPRGPRPLGSLARHHLSSAL